MDRAINGAGCKGGLQFFCEQALATDFGEPAVQHFIAGRLHIDDFDGLRCQPMGRNQPVAHRSGLPKRQRAAACSNSEFVHRVACLYGPADG